MKFEGRFNRVSTKHSGSEASYDVREIVVRSCKLVTGDAVIAAPYGGGRVVFDQLLHYQASAPNQLGSDEVKDLQYPAFDEIQIYVTRRFGSSNFSRSNLTSQHKNGVKPKVSVRSLPLYLFR